MIPHTAPAAWPGAVASTRFAAGVRTAWSPECRVGLIGLPDDLGVRLNGGRPGARGGPSAFRAALSSYGVIDPEGVEWPVVFDAGDVEPAPGEDEAALRETHRRVSGASAALARAGLFPVAVGGGHDLTYAFVRGAVEGLRGRGAAAGGLECVYFDAHLDVRETVGSGMPFRRLAEELDARLTPIGINPMSNSRSHAVYARGRGVRAGEDRSRLMAAVSLDLDVLDAAYAPGVSAMNASGMTPREVEAGLTALSREGRVICFDVMELNPAFDAGERTARLAAHLFLSFLAARFGGPR